MIMDSLREFVIDTDPLRALFSQPVAKLEQSESLVGMLGLFRLCLNAICIE